MIKFNTKELTPAISVSFRNFFEGAAPCPRCVIPIFLQLKMHLAIFLRLKGTPCLFLAAKFHSFIEKKKMYPLIFYRKHLARKKWICMEDDENKISFIKEVEIKDGKVDTIYSALSNEI